MARKGPTDQDGAGAIRRLLSGLERGDDVFALAAAIEELHPPHNTFPGEVFMRLSTDALEVAGVGLRPAVVSPVKDHLAGQASLDSMPPLPQVRYLPALGLAAGRSARGEQVSR
jgi:hypothetical protein